MPYSAATYHPTSHGIYRKRWDYERHVRRLRQPQTTSMEAGAGVAADCCGLIEPLVVIIVEEFAESVTK